MYCRNRFLLRLGKVRAKAEEDGEASRPILNIVPMRFCSKECLEAIWPRHKAWHKEQKKWAKLAKATVPQQDEAFIAHARKIASSENDRYTDLLAKGSPGQPDPSLP